MTDTIDRHCAIGRVRIRRRNRNAGESFGLDYPFIVGRIAPRTWTMWNRHTGHVASVTYDKKSDTLARLQASATCEAINGRSKENSELINALHDLEA